MKKKNLYLLISLSIISIVFLIIGYFEKWVYNYKLIMGLSLIAFCYFTYLITRNYFNYVVGLILLIGIFSVISFVPFSISFGIGFLKFELIPLFFSILFIYINRSRVLDLIQNFSNISDEEKSNESKKN